MLEWGSGSDVRMANCSQISPTPSGHLSDPFKNMCLASQQRTNDSLESQRPPVPLFSQAAARQSQPIAHAESCDVPCSQLEYLATQDFITPADQFGLEYEPGAANGVRHQRSPAQLSPNRIKRARKDPIEGNSPNILHFRVYICFYNTYLNVQMILCR